MLKIYTLANLSKQEIDNLCKRNADESNLVANSVAGIIEQVKLYGDQALYTYAQKFDGVELKQLVTDQEELESLAASVGETERNAIDTAYRNIEAFHASQLNREKPVETMPGVTCWRENRAIERVGLYIPGGTAVLPSTLLMLGIPARLAGCKEIIVCSPPQKNGKVNAYIAYCAKLLGIRKIYLAGGAQAIGAMAYGTESITKVDKIFGPGNQYVTYAKKFVQMHSNVAIDMPAGPSEVLIIADEKAKPVFVAADLLAQAEHGADSQVVLLSTSAELAKKISEEVEKQLELLPRRAYAGQALDHSFAVITSTIEECITFSNRYAPEHLILAIENWESYIPLISNAGSVFCGEMTPESAGDYASGTNHTLPTSAYAKAYSGVSIDSFIKKITFQHITDNGIRNIGPAVETLAAIEGLQAHKNAVTIRISAVNDHV